MWATGNLTYGGAIFVANLVLMFKFNNIDEYNVLCISSGVIAYFIASYIKNKLISIPDLYCVFYDLFSEVIVWIALIFIVGLISVLELAHRAMKQIVYADCDLRSVHTDPPAANISTQCQNYSSEKPARSINDTHESITSPLNDKE